MWYAAQARGEYAKIGSFIPETLAIITLLSVRGVSVPFWHIPLYYLTLMIVAAGVGRFLVWVGILRYNTTLGNNHNAELRELLEWVRKQK